jgi:Uma2 family endonuclease
VSVQNPLRLGERSEPQADLVLARPRPDFYAQAHPGPADVFLVVEVAETSVDVDRQLKVPLYARAGIPEVWLVDLPGEAVEVSRRPSPQGYQVSACPLSRFLARATVPCSVSALHFPP